MRVLKFPVDSIPGGPMYDYWAQEWLHKQLFALEWHRVYDVLDHVADGIGEFTRHRLASRPQEARPRRGD